MKFIISVLCTAALAFALSLYMPWWAIGIAAFLVAFFIPLRTYVSFLAGFIAIFLLWTTLCLIISSANDDLFAHKFSMLILQVDNPILLILITGLLGAIVAACAAATGSLARKLFVREK